MSATNHAENVERRRNNVISCPVTVSYIKNNMDFSPLNSLSQSKTLLEKKKSNFSSKYKVMKMLKEKKKIRILKHIWHIKIYKMRKNGQFFFF